MAKIEDIIYIAIHLDESTHQKVVGMVNHNLLPFEMGTHTMYGDHITLAFGENAKKREILKVVGMEVKNLSPARILHNSIGMGVFFEKKLLELRGIPFLEDSKPHCTVCMINGIPPKYMGQMTEMDHSVIMADPKQHFSGKIKAYCRDGQWHGHISCV